jgi:hypothetical protein
LPSFRFILSGDQRQAVGWTELAGLIVISRHELDVDNGNQSPMCYIALKDAGVPTEMHLYADGGRAFGAAPHAA